MRFKKISSAHTFRERELKDCFLRGENIAFMRDGIASRPGVKLLGNPVIFSPDEFISGYPEFTLTDTEINIDNTLHRIAVTVESDGHSNLFYHVSALSKNGKSSLGTITFSRSSADSFGTPDSFIIFDGKPTVGSGIYFLARIVTENEPETIRLCELSSDRKSWLYIPESEIYCPTLLQNGRGASATKAISEGLRLSAPYSPEGMNMLGEKYKAGYTTDGYSFYYTLPKFPILGKIEGVMTLDTGLTARWVIEDGSNESEMAEIEGVKIHLRCDRKNGRIITDSDEKLCVPLPFTGLENNLVFTLSADRGASLSRVSSLTACKRIFADSSASSNGVAVFTGSRLYPTDIIWNSPENPLYFPENNRLSLPSPVIGLCEIKRSLLLLEKDGFSSVKAEIKPASSGFESSIKLSVAPKTELHRRIIPETVAEGVDKAFLCTENGDVFSVTSALTCKKEAELRGILPDRGVTFSDRYLAICGDTVFVLDPESPSPDPVPWRMPREILSSADFEGTPVFYSRDDGDRVLAYTLSGEYDEFDGEPLPVSCFFEAELWGEPWQCRLHEISVMRNGKPFLLSLFSGDEELLSKPLGEDTERSFFSAVFRTLTARFSFSGGTEFRKAGLKFSRFSKL